MSEVNKIDQGREGTQWSEQEFCRNRFYNFLGNRMPSTISVKELGGDNAIDQISDGKTNVGYIEIGEDFRSVTVLDGGKGISLRQTIRKDNGKPSTFLFLNVAKLYTSTNYQEDANSNIADASSTIGQNGIGTKVSNFCSSHFTVGIVAKNPEKHSSKVVVNTIPEDTFNQSIHDKIYGTEKNPATGCVKGYHFQRGIETIDGTPMDEAVPEWIRVNVPKFYEQDGTFGYFVHAEYDQEILGDDIDCNWIKDYIKARLSGCSNTKEDITFVFRYPTKSDDDDKVKMNEVIFVKPVNPKEFEKSHKKEIESGKLEIITSWEDMCEEVKRANPDKIWGPFDYGFFKIYYSKDAELLANIPNIAQGAKVNNPKQFMKAFTVGNSTIKIPVPCVFKLSAKNARGLGYNDQTKERLASNQKTPAKLHINCLEKQFDKVLEMKEYFNKLANDKFLAGTGKKIHSDFYWPANGGETAREFFSKGVTKKEDLAFILNQIKDDEDVAKYCKENNIDFDKLYNEVCC